MPLEAEAAQDHFPTETGPHHRGAAREVAVAAAEGVAVCH